ncbi:small-subunit processome [Cyathus striatus]|nr:small-subunit processome [Cyathus striatus]
MTSSLRNSVHRRNHKERSQLAHRSHLGLLEKHKDYVKRARDYHAKRDRLTNLRQKAADRNKDEFYFSMTREKTKGGVHVKERGNVALPTDVVKILKTQDENYVRTMRAAGLKKIDKIKRHLMEMADLLKPNMRQGLHIIFVDSPQQGGAQMKRKRTADETQDSPNTILNEEDVDLGWKSSQPKRKKVKKPAFDQKNGKEGEAGDVRKRRLLKELSARLARDKLLRYTEREFEMQRLMMGKGARKKISGVEKVEGEESEEDEDEIDARKGKRRELVRKVDEKTYKPRVYKWRLERK